MRKTVRMWATCLALSPAGCVYNHGSDDAVTGPSGVVRGSGVLSTESRPASGFRAIAVSGAGHLVLERAGVASLSVTAEDNVLPYLTAEIVGDRLVLGSRSGVSLSLTREVVYRISAPDVCDIAASGASRAEAFTLECSTFVADSSGASSITVAGVTGHQQVRASGASFYGAAELLSRTAGIDMSGASRGIVRVREELAVVASGSSSLEYFGSPLVRATTTGGSWVRRIGD